MMEIFYYPLFLLYCIAAAVALPIPVEAGLLNAAEYWEMLLLALIMGVGKAAGSNVVYRIGLNFDLENGRLKRFRWWRNGQRHLVKLLEHHGYAAMYVIMSIPLMTDTVPLYAFSLLNKDGEVFSEMWFVITNFWAGMSRAFLVFILAMLGLWVF